MTIPQCNSLHCPLSFHNVVRDDLNGFICGSLEFVKCLCCSFQVLSHHKNSPDSRKLRTITSAHDLPIHYTAVQSQKVVSAYFTSKQKPPFGFARQWHRSTSAPHVIRLYTCPVPPLLHQVTPCAGLMTV